MLNFINLTAQNGILIKDGRSLELLNTVDTVVFDKTGTLMLEQPIVGTVHTFNHHDEEAVLTYAAAAEYRQSHPIAKAILQAANERGFDLPEIDAAQYEVGYGIGVSFANKQIHVGSLRFMGSSAKVAHTTRPARGVLPGRLCVTFTLLPLWICQESQCLQR